MKPEEFTQKALEAIGEANELAKRYNHSQIEVEHILAALLEQEGGIVQQIFVKSGANLALARQMAGASCTAEAVERLQPGCRPIGFLLMPS